MFSIEHDVVTLLVSDFSVDKIHELMECNKTIYGKFNFGQNKIF